MKLKLGSTVIVIGASGSKNPAIVTRLHSGGDTLNGPECANVRMIADADNPNEKDAVYTSVRIFDTEAEALRSGDSIIGWVHQ